jgi:hypothetical protein
MAGELLPEDQDVVWIHPASHQIQQSISFEFSFKIANNACLTEVLKHASVGSQMVSAPS